VQGRGSVLWDVYTVVTMANVFWDITLSGFSKNRRFG
jgi:hypothetical protein